MEFPMTPSSGRPQEEGGRGFKLMNDPIHGHIEVPWYCLQFIDTPQFQRLRYLKQLGTTSFVFTGAVHTRFEHSVGVSHLANRVVTQLQQRQPELEISDREVKLVTLAGLCHDLGHGPFSHAFEQWVHSMGRTDWHHEARSHELVQYLIDDNALDYDAQDIHFVNDLITGRKVDADSQLERGFLYEIVANKRNNVDVDKFDYLARDTYYCGMPQANFERLLINHRVIGNELTFHKNEATTLMDLFATRYKMFSQVYCHHVGWAIEAMIGDVFTAANDHMQILANCDDIAQYALLNDSILNEIERSHSAELTEAQRLLKRLRKRDLYKVVGSVILPFEARARLDAMNHEERICGYTDPAANVTLDDLVVKVGVLDFGMKNANPLKQVKFFKSWDRDAPASYMDLKDEVSFVMMPTSFSEVHFSCICKTPHKTKAVFQAWTRYVRDEWKDAQSASPFPQHDFSLGATPNMEETKTFARADGSRLKRTKLTL